MSIKCPRRSPWCNAGHPARRNCVEIVYFTVVGIGLYFFSDWLLDQIERLRGRRFAQRQLVFFVIILVLAVASFQLIGLLSRPGS